MRARFTSAMSTSAMSRTAVGIGVGLLALLLQACAGFGTAQLRTDQVDYARALAQAQQRQTLANIVGLRYADPVLVLPVSSVIAAYAFDASLNTSLAASTADGAPVTGQLGAAAGYATRPTFTFTPLTGEDYANAYIRPLAPALVLPLIQSGVPVDVLFRLVVQSVGDLQNGAVLSGRSDSGDVGFFELIQALRRLQIRGMLSARLEAAPARVFLTLRTGRDGDAPAQADAAQARRLLQLPPGTDEFEVVYGGAPVRGARVGIVTRSITGVLMEVGAQIPVPVSDVERGATLPGVGVLDIEQRPVIRIHSGERAPADAWASAGREGRSFWIARDDFDSKFAFGVVQNLIALAQSARGAGAPLVTIPAGP